MHQVRLEVLNVVGLHARPAALLVAEAAKYKADIRIRNATTNSRWVSAKSILSVLTLGVEKGHEIELTTEGEDSAQAMQALLKLFEHLAQEPA